MVTRYCFLLMLFFNSCSDRMDHEKKTPLPHRIVITVHDADFQDSSNYDRNVDHSGIKDEIKHSSSIK